VKVTRSKAASAGAPANAAYPASCEAVPGRHPSCRRIRDWPRDRSAVGQGFLGANPGREPYRELPQFGPKATADNRSSRRPTIRRNRAAAEAEVFGMGHVQLDDQDQYSLDVTYAIFSGRAVGRCRTWRMCELPLAPEVPGRSGPERIFEDKPVVEQTSRYHAAAL
jgi:hypothetical protein